MEIDRIKWDQFLNPLFDRGWSGGGRAEEREGKREKLSQRGVIYFTGGKKIEDLCTRLGKKTSQAVARLTVYLRGH